MFETIKCRWCEKTIPKGYEVIVIKPALLEDDGFNYADQTIAVYHPDCWEEFVKGVSS